MHPTLCHAVLQTMHGFVNVKIRTCIRIRRKMEIVGYSNTECNVPELDEVVCHRNLKSHHTTQNVFAGCLEKIILGLLFE